MAYRWPAFIGILILSPPRQPKEVVKVGPPLTKLPDSAHVYFVCANI